MSNNGNSSSNGSLQDPPTKIKPCLSVGSFQSCKSPTSPTGTTWTEWCEKSLRDETIIPQAPISGAGEAHNFYTEAKRSRSRSVVERPPPHLVVPEAPYSGYHHSLNDNLCTSPNAGHPHLNPRVSRAVDQGLNILKSPLKYEKVCYCPKCNAYNKVPNFYVICMKCWHCSNQFYGKMYN